MSKFVSVCVGDIVVVEAVVWTVLGVYLNGLSGGIGHVSMETRGAQGEHITVHGYPIESLPRDKIYRPVNHDGIAKGIP